MKRKEQSVDILTFPGDHSLTTAGHPSVGFHHRAWGDIGLNKLSGPKDYVN